MFDLSLTPDWLSLPQVGLGRFRLRDSKGFNCMHMAKLVPMENLRKLLRMSVTGAEFALVCPMAKEI